MNERLVTIAADFEDLAVAYDRRWFLNGPGHPDNDRLYQLSSAAAEAHASLNRFLYVLGE